MPARLGRALLQRDVHARFLLRVLPAGVPLPEWRRLPQRHGRVHLCPGLQSKHPDTHTHTHTHTCTHTHTHTHTHTRACTHTHTHTHTHVHAHTHTHACTHTLTHTTTHTEQPKDK